jgi:outer membrane protein assembly factor BamD
MRIIILLLGLCLLPSCSYFGGDKKEDETENWSADRLYNEAKGALDAGDWSKAISMYERLESRFPFGVYGQQSVLDLAYAYYKSDQPEAAVSAANRFIKLYPQNDHVDYAYYLKGLANFNKGKGLIDRIARIDTSQRDPGAAMLAFQDFSELVERYPDSQYAPDSRKRMVYLRNILAEHEVHVAHYYMRRSAYLAAANRARLVVEQYQRTPSVPDALSIMAKAYKILGMDDLSRDSLRVLELNYPNYPGIREVQEIVITEG